MVPTSCEHCQPTELSNENLWVFELVSRFPGMIQFSTAGAASINFAYGRYIAEKEYITDDLFFLECLEAITRGLNVK